jgi:exopolysaccharide production protein ExoZ
MSSTAPSKQIDTLQVLRGIAALLVCVAHYHHEFIQRPGGTTMSFGGFGVDLFFVISGFVMVHSSASLFGQRGAPLNFLLRRLARVAPLYWLGTLILVLYVAGSQTFQQADLNIASVIGSFLFWPIARPSGHFVPVLTVGWTLNLELFFYALFAAALVMRRFAAVAVSCITLGIFIALGPSVGGAVSSETFAFWAQPLLVEFAFGMCIALAYQSDTRLPRATGAALMLLGTLIAGFAFAAHPASFNSLSRAVVWGGAAASIVAGAVLSDWPFESRTSRRFVEFGNASYALYLVHPLLITLPHEVYGRLWAYSGVVVPVKNWPYLLALLTATICVSIALFRYVEKPLVRTLQRHIDTRFPVERAEPCLQRTRNAFRVIKKST